MPKQVRRAAAKNMTKQEFEKQVKEIFSNGEVEFVYKKEGFHRLIVKATIIWFDALIMLNKLVNVEYIIPIEADEHVINEITFWNDDLDLEGQ